MRRKEITKGQLFQIGIRLEPSLFDEVARLAKQDERTPAQLARLALREYLDRRREEEAAGKKKAAA